MTTKASRKQSLRTAVRLAGTDGHPLCRAANYLVGCPAGGWAETAQARRQLVDDLPARDARSYTAEEFIAAVLTLDHADRYIRR